MQTTISIAGIEVEIIDSDDVRNLLRREAGIAIRHALPEQSDLIAMIVNETSDHLYASAEFLNEIANPQPPCDLEHVDPPCV